MSLPMEIVPVQTSAARHGITVRTLAASTIPEDRCFRLSSGMLILLWDLMIRGLFMGSGKITAPSPLSLLVARIELCLGANIFGLTHLGRITAMEVLTSSATQRDTTVIYL